MSDCFRAQLTQQGKNSVGFAMTSQDTHRPGEINVLRHPCNIYQVNWFEKRLGLLDIRGVQLESGNATLVTQPCLFNIFPIEVYPNDPAVLAPTIRSKPFPPGQPIMATLPGEYAPRRMPSSSAISCDRPTAGSAICASQSATGMSSQGLRIEECFPL